MTQRNTYFDFLRGIAISMVVAIHCFKSIDSIAFRQILNTAVPLFIAISGFFLAQKSITDSQGYISFLKKQIPKVYIPTLLWSLPWFLLSIRSGGELATQITLLLFCGYSIYYFIAFIVQCYIVLPAISAMEQKSHRGG